MSDDKGNSRRWRIEVLAKPTPAHVADALEMVDGEAVRRVTLPEVDFKVVTGHNELEKRLGRRPDLADLMDVTDLDAASVNAALNRLSAMGLLPEPENRGRLQ